MNLLVIRLSAMGDVALTLPAIRAVLDQYPDVSVTMVTRKSFLPFFSGIQRLTCVAAEVKGKHRGISGLYRLYREINRDDKPDAVLDLHDVLRSHILSFYFRCTGIPVYRIDKGRREKRRLTARRRKQFRPLTHTVQRYLKVFEKAGFPAGITEKANHFKDTVFPEKFLQAAGVLPKRMMWVGIAPFARHREKVWPAEKMDRVIELLDKREIPVFLFGGGQEERAKLHELGAKYRHAVVVAGALSLPEELGLIGRLDAMVSMDSANMHLAALSGIPVVSVWGATHPFAGFGPLGDNGRLMVQIPQSRLTCRPCAVFGNKPCWRGDHACMEWITPAMVLEKITGMLNDAPAAPGND